MKIPENLQLAIQDILSNGGKPYLVGGAVRDMVLGINPKDLDVEVFNMPIGKLAGVLAGVGPINTVGQAHGCIKMRFDELEVDFTIPRMDNKIGVGHPDFEHVFFPDMKLSDAILRRDFTMNPK
jgi:tRNA nucleotidyltransferase (CCA-adding enzyme)